MQISRLHLYNRPQTGSVHTLPAGCALTIGNFDGVHRGHQAMLALLTSEAHRRGVPSVVLTFEPHPRDFFAAQQQNPKLAPARIATLRDKMTELAACGIDHAVIMGFDKRLASLCAQSFMDHILQERLQTQYLLAGDDFRFGAGRSGDHALLASHGFDLGRLHSYDVDGERVSSTLVRSALSHGDMAQAARLLGRPYSISGHVVHGRKLGRSLGETATGRGDGFRTLNLRFSHWKPAASGIFVVQVHGLAPHPLRGVANLGVRPSLDANDVNGGRVLLETHCLDWPAQLGSEGAYGKIIKVDLLHKLHDELRYESLQALQRGIALDIEAANSYFAAHPNAPAAPLLPT